MTAFFCVSFSSWLIAAQPSSAAFRQGQSHFETTPHYFPRGWQEVDQDENRLRDYQGFNHIQNFGGGVAARDINGDHRIDLAVVTEEGLRWYYQGPNGQWEPQGILPDVNAAAFIFDITGNGALDIVGGEIAHLEERKVVNPAQLHIWPGPDGTPLNEECRFPSVFEPSRNMFGLAAGDANNDGRLDLFMAHWSQGARREEPHLWLNEGNCSYFPADASWGIYGNFEGRDFSFTPFFSDIDNNGYPDLLVTSDYETSQYFTHNGKDRYINRTRPDIIDDQNGMGAAAGDFNNDGLIDWFATAVWSDETPSEETEKGVYGNWGTTGNRLYQNTGNGEFANVSREAGISNGNWGWGACAADFNNDGRLDLYHVNGFALPKLQLDKNPTQPFAWQPSRLFIQNEKGTFDEQAQEWGVAEPNEGRAVACFDHGRDGDIDFLYTQAHGPSRFFINTLNDHPDTAQPYLGIIPKGIQGNLAAAGAKIYLFPETGDDQMREIRIGGNFLGQHPPEAHFGLGGTKNIQTVLIQWPGKPARYTTLRDIKPNQWIVVNHPERVKAGEPEWEPLPDSAKIAP
ncbi:MAG: CRTAC1 family protein [Pseudomonadota bacterium]